MLQYVNTFNCICDSNEETVVIRFSQSEPRSEDDGSITTELHEISSLAMSKAGAQALIDTLSNVLSQLM